MKRFIACIFIIVHQLFSSVRSAKMKSFNMDHGELMVSMVLGGLLSLKQLVILKRFGFRIKRSEILTPANHHVLDHTKHMYSTTA